LLAARWKKKGSMGETKAKEAERRKERKSYLFFS
jgi:hypothetical protein